MRGDSGGIVLALIEGEAGIGKTALWSEVVVRARAAGVRVIAARPTAAEAASSYATLDELMQPVLGLVRGDDSPRRRALATALLLEPSQAPPDARAVALGLASLVEELAAERSLLIALDDWQWIDPASAAVLVFALRRLPASRATVLATVRTGEADDAVAALVRSLPAGSVVELPLDPLDAAALRQLIRARTGRWLAPTELQRLTETSRGNALAALELMRDDAPLAGDVRRLLAARVAVLPRPARDVLRCVAALAAPSAAAVEAAVEDHPQEGMEAALTADVLVRDGERLRLAHPLFGLVVEERTPPAEWRALHARLATLVENVEERARHLALAAIGPDPAVAEALDAAAVAALARGAPGAAAELAERAGELTPSEQVDERCRRFMSASDAYVSAADGRRAQRVLWRVVDELPAGPRRARALIRLADVAPQGDQRALVERALAEAGADDCVLVEVHSFLAQLHANKRSAPELVERHAAAAIEHAQRADNVVWQSSALTALAMQRFRNGEGVQRQALVQAERLERRAATRSPWSQWPLTYLGMQLSHTGELDEGRAVLQAEWRRAQARADVGHEGNCLYLLADTELRAGRLALAEDLAQRALEIKVGLDLGNTEAAARWAMAKVYAYRGRANDAREHANRSIALSRVSGDKGWLNAAIAVLGFLELSCGDAKAAVEMLSPLRPPDTARDPEIVGALPDLIEALTLGRGA